MSGHTERSKVSRIVGWLVVGAWAFAVLPSIANAQCTSSTPSSTSFADLPSDGEAGLAPEVTTVVVSIDDSCHYTVDPGIATPLADGSSVTEYINTDGDTATGASLFGGADIAVVTEELPWAPSTPQIGVYDPWAENFYFSSSTATPVGNGGFSATLDQLGIARPTTTGVEVFAVRPGRYTAQTDLAPDLDHGSIPFPVEFGFDDVAVPELRLPPGCTVPRVTGLRQRAAVHALRVAGCRAPDVMRVYSASIGRGRVVRSLPPASTRSRQHILLVVSRGPRPRR